jgi:hypothetical protein
MVYFATYSVIFRSMLAWLIAEKDLRLARGGGGISHIWFYIKELPPKYILYEFPTR